MFLLVSLAVRGSVYLYYVSTSFSSVYLYSCIWSFLPVRLLVLLVWSFLPPRVAAHVAARVAARRTREEHRHHYIVVLPR